jgi:hypothetical protein
MHLKRGAKTETTPADKSTAKDAKNAKAQMYITKIINLWRSPQTPHSRKPRRPPVDARVRGLGL